MLFPAQWAASDKANHVLEASMKNVAKIGKIGPFREPPLHALLRKLRKNQVGRNCSAKVPKKSATPRVYLLRLTLMSQPNGISM